MTEFSKDEKGNVNFVSSYGANAASGGHKTAKGQKQPTQQVNTKEQKNKPWSPWGTNNIFPFEVIDNANTVSLVDAILDWKARALYGGGIVYGTTEVDENGNESFKRIFDNEIEEWLECTGIQNYLMDASTYFYYFHNIFPELVQTKDGKKITYLTCLESTDCRWARRTEEGGNKGLIENCFVSPDWRTLNSEEVVDKIMVVQTQRNPHEQLKRHRNEKFIYPVSYPSPGRNYYQRPAWHVLLDTWMPIAKEIPATKKAILKNQITVKYLVKIPASYWKLKYKDFDKKPEKEQLEIYQNEVTRFNDFMSGAENAGKSLLVTIQDGLSHQDFKEWKIEVIDDKLGDGKYIEDSQEADAHIFKNLNVDPTLFGAGPGKNTTSSGSGSDKRVAWNNYIIMCKPHQDVILQPLNFIAKYNKWSERLTKGKDNAKFSFMFKNYMIAKLDSGKETQEA